MNLSNNISRSIQLKIKRLIDIIGSIILIIICLPFYLLISVWILIKFGRPIFFIQTRPGFKGKPFKIIKFRTMLNFEKDNKHSSLNDSTSSLRGMTAGSILNLESKMDFKQESKINSDSELNPNQLHKLNKEEQFKSEAEHIVESDAKRLTKFGMFLRNTSLDEIPEFWNVLKGEMSLVGPRPLLMEYLPLYTKEQFKRHDMKPGITGIAQVKGRNEVEWKSKFKYDTFYVEKFSIWLDLKILYLTLFKVIKREGVSKQGYKTTSYFKGKEK